MAAVLKPSVNVFAILESDDPGDTHLADVGAAQAKATAGPKRRARKFYKKQEPQMSPWKKNKLKAEAEEAAKKKLQQQLAAYTDTNTAGRNRRPQPPAAPSRAPPVMAAANVAQNRKPQRPAVPSMGQVRTAATAAMNMKPKHPAAVSKAHVATTADADKQIQQPPAAPARGNLFDQLFAYANSVRAFIYGNRKQNGPANAKDGVTGDAPTDDEKGERRLA